MLNHSAEVKSHRSMNTKIFRIIQIAAIAVFLGRGWQHLFWDAPFRALLWDEDWMSGIVQAVLGMEWKDYITNLEVNDHLENLIK